MEGRLVTGQRVVPTAMEGGLVTGQRVVVLWAAVVNGVEAGTRVVVAGGEVAVRTAVQMAETRVAVAVAEVVAGGEVAARTAVKTAETRVSVAVAEVVATMADADSRHQHRSSCNPGPRRSLDCTTACTRPTGAEAGAAATAVAKMAARAWMVEAPASEEGLEVLAAAKVHGSPLSHRN